MRSKKLSSVALLSAAAVAGICTGAHAVAFTPGDVAVYRLGTGAAALSSAGTAAFIDEYSPTGSLIQSLPVPTAPSGTNNPLVNSGTATSEGNLTLSGNGAYLLFAGYDTTPGTASVASSSTSTILRDFGRVDLNGNFDTSTTTTSFNGNNPRSVASQDGATLYAAGANTGVISLTVGGSGAGTVVSSTVTNNRVVEVSNSQLYVSTGSGGSYRIATVGSGLPTGTGNTYTELSGIPINTSSGTEVVGPYEYLFASSTGGSTPDTLYVADAGLVVGAGDTGAIEKFVLSAGSYVPAGSVGLNASTGITGIQTTVGGVLTENLYATTPNGLYELTDNALAGQGTLTGSFNLLASPGTNEAFRGIAPVPTVSVAVPEPTTLAMLGVGAVALVGSRRGKNRDSSSRS